MAHIYMFQTPLCRLSLVHNIDTGLSVKTASKVPLLRWR